MRRHKFAAAVSLLVLLLATALPAFCAERIGLFLGTFDPPHQGIARMIEEATRRLDLTTIYVMPTPEPVDRPEVTPVQHRLAMLQEILALHFPANSLAPQGSGWPPFSAHSRLPEPLQLFDPSENPPELPQTGCGNPETAMTPAKSLSFNNILCKVRFSTHLTPVRQGDHNCRVIWTLGPCAKRF